MDALLGIKPVKCMEIRQIGGVGCIQFTLLRTYCTHSGSSAFCNIWKNKYFIHVSSYQSPGSVERRVFSSIFLPLSFHWAPTLVCTLTCFLLISLLG